ncbi:hypothetical protein BK010_03575 [Tenericutes bacterium MO-XQ]|nr:hypothetical protein BK010_03575 [Tenericutes bacterium MO-XQ]
MNQYILKPITIDDVYAIQAWRYTGFMKEIYVEPYITSYNEFGVLRGPENCDGFGVFVNDSLFGIFEYYWKDSTMEIGLAIHPDFVGKGLSDAFINAGIAFGISHYGYEKGFVQLSVEIDNIAAYKAYLKNGFVEVSRDLKEILMYKYLRSF